MCVFKINLMQKVNNNIKEYFGLGYNNNIKVNGPNKKYYWKK